MSNSSTVGKMPQLSRYSNNRHNVDGTAHDERHVNIESKFYEHHGMPDIGEKGGPMYSTPITLYRCAVPEPPPIVSVSSGQVPY